MSYTVGQVVGVLRSGSWSTVAQGKYTVSKINLRYVELTRADGHTRKFSVKTGHEFGSYTDNTFIVSEDRFDQHVQVKQLEQHRQQAVVDIRSAIDGVSRYGMSTEDITKIRALLDNAEKFAFVI